MIRIEYTLSPHLQTLPSFDPETSISSSATFLVKDTVTSRFVSYAYIAPLFLVSTCFRFLKFSVFWHALLVSSPFGFPACRFLSVQRFSCLLRLLSSHPCCHFFGPLVPCQYPSHFSFSPVLVFSFSFRRSGTRLWTHGSGVIRHLFRPVHPQPRQADSKLRHDQHRHWIRNPRHVSTSHRHRRFRIAFDKRTPHDQPRVSALQPLESTV